MTIVNSGLKGFGLRRMIIQIRNGFRLKWILSKRGVSLCLKAWLCHCPSRVLLSTTYWQMKLICEVSTKQCPMIATFSINLLLAYPVLSMYYLCHFCISWIRRYATSMGSVKGTTYTQIFAHCVTCFSYTFLSDTDQYNDEKYVIIFLLSVIASYTGLGQMMD